jgi:ELMO domain-containing protein
VPHKLLTNDWKEIGFQNKNPRTDFRGGGVLSLQCLKYFVKKQPDLFKDMLSSGSEFFFIIIIY